MLRFVLTILSLRIIMSKLWLIVCQKNIISAFVGFIMWIGCYSTDMVNIKLV